MFLYAQDFFVKKMACNVYQRIATQTANFSIETRKPNLKRKCQILVKFYVRVRQFRENMTLEIFARVQVSSVFSETSYTIKTKINHFVYEYMAICWITNTIT